MLNPTLRLNHFLRAIHTSASSSVMSKSGEAMFGAGCFWGTDKFFRKQFALKTCFTGYAGGTKEQPSYKEVCTGKTGHAEVIHITYDPSKVDYKGLVQFFFRMHDPTTLNRQGNDVGTQYRSVIYYYDEDQKKIAEEVKKEVQEKHYKSSQVVSEISASVPFWKAEDYHQEYLINNPDGYCNHKLRW